MLKCISRRYLTLIELMVVMAIISMVAGIVGININKSIQEQRFRTEVGQILDKLRLAQNLMLILNQDVEVHFKNVDGGIRYWLSFQCPLNKGWDREINREQPLLSSIGSIEFSGDSNEYSSEGLNLKFLSAGLVMSRGILKLSTGQGRSYNDQRYICLRGYPAPLSSVNTPDNSCLNPKETSINDQMTQFIMPEIQSKLQPRP